MVDRAEINRLKRKQMARDDGIYRALGTFAFMLLSTSIVLFLREGFSAMTILTIVLFGIVLVGLAIMMLLERRALITEGQFIDKGKSSAANETGIQMIAERKFYEPYLATIGVGEKSLPLRIYDYDLALYVDYYVWLQDECLKFFPKWHAKTVVARKVTDLPETLDLSESYKVTSIALGDIEYFTKVPAPPSITQPKGGRKTILQTRDGAIDYPATAFEVFSKLFPEKARAER